MLAQKQLNNALDAADEKYLQSICKNLYYTAKSDEEKEKYNQELLTAFDNILKNENSFHLTFDSLKKDIGILFSPDKKVKIIVWSVESSAHTFRYYGYIQSKIADSKKKKNKSESVQVFPLIDKSSEIRNPENTITDNKKWFGMLYYKIILKKHKSKIYYTLLGYDPNDAYTNKKIIDVLTFDNNGAPKFGADIFVMEKKYPKRVIFEYAENCTMSLRYNEKKDSVIFDHLAPTEPQLEGQYQYYCGDMSYDGFGFKKGKWYYGTDLNATNDWNERDKFYNNPKNTNTNKQSNILIERKKKNSSTDKKK